MDEVAEMGVQGIPHTLQVNNSNLRLIQDHFVQLLIINYDTFRRCHHWELYTQE